MERLGLAWVLVDGRPRCVSDFAALAPRRRPPATCPECGRRLTLKLGRIRRHHAAHAPHDQCIATQPETALHIDVKLYVASQLQAAIGRDRELVMRRRCEGTPVEPCEAERNETWLRGWDEVVVEASIASADGGRRPDILLRSRGKGVGAIEVLVSHAVSDDKARALARAGLPWVEVRADARLLDAETAWSIDQPLPVERAGKGGAFGAWRCDRHVRKTARLLGARVVDVYRDGGVRDRVIYRVDEQLVEGEPSALGLVRDGREIASCPCDDGAAAKRAAWGALRLAFAEDVRRLTSDGAAFADSPMRWASGAAAENLVHEAYGDVYPGDTMPLATRYPHRWFFARDRGRWFLPRDMRDVRWDRPAHDAFAAHPAWTASRAVVRERPVPEHAWNTVLFAKRPSSGAFGVDLATAPKGPIVVVELGEDVVEEAHRVPRRAIVVLTAPAEDDEVRAVDRSLDDAGVEHLWLSHPLDWDASRGDLAWAAAARDGRGRGVVVVDGLGVYRADAFVRAFRRGDPGSRPDAVRARMSARVASLGGARRRS